MLSLGGDGKVKHYWDTGSSPFLEFKFPCLAAAGPHPPYDHTHQEYG